MNRPICYYDFNADNKIAKRNTLYATIFTAIMMIVEIIGGIIYNSMALLADGWHMSSHAFALGLAFVAYLLATKYNNDARFSFGTYKIEVLGGYTSAICLLGVAVFMAFHSIERILNPIQIAYKEAIIIAFVGLGVNLICAWLLKNDHNHVHHDHSHDHSHDKHSHDDINLKAAYIHIITDAMTSIFAIIALFGGMLFNAMWLDPIMGIVGSILVFIWAISLIKQSSKILIDATMDEHIVKKIIDSLDCLKKQIVLLDLHIFSVGKGKYGCIIALHTNTKISIQEIKKSLYKHSELVHISVEINH